MKIENYYLGMFEGVAEQLSHPGAVGVIPTDTIYGIVARTADEAAVERLYRIKARDQKPGTIIAASVDQLEKLGLKHRYITAVKDFWPGALSVIIPSSDPALTYLHRGKMSLAVRIPDAPELSALLEKTGPLVTSSANQPDEPPADTVAEAKIYFGEEPDFYIDGGDLSNRAPSTIIRMLDDAIEVVREGAVKIDPRYLSS